MKQLSPKVYNEVYNYVYTLGLFRQYKVFNNGVQNISTFLVGRCLSIVAPFICLYTQSLTTKASESTPDDAHDDDDDDADDDQLLAGQDIDPDRLKSFNVSSYT